MSVNKEAPVFSVNKDSYHNIKLTVDITLNKPEANYQRQHSIEQLPIVIELSDEENYNVKELNCGPVLAETPSKVNSNSSKRILRSMTKSKKSVAVKENEPMLFNSRRKTEKKAKALTKDITDVKIKHPKRVVKPRRKICPTEGLVPEQPKLLRTEETSVCLPTGTVTGTKPKVSKSRKIVPKEGRVALTSTQTNVAIEVMNNFKRAEVATSELESNLAESLPSTSSSVVGKEGKLIDCKSNQGSQPMIAGPRKFSIDFFDFFETEDLERDLIRLESPDNLLSLNLSMISFNEGACGGLKSPINPPKTDSLIYYECNCCYNDVPFDYLVQCTDGHLFCIQCLERYAQEAIYGSGDLNLVCLSDGCEATFPKSQIFRALPDSLREKYDERVQIENINKADFENFTRCIRCGFGAILDAREQFFVCPQCPEVFCRLCNVRRLEHGQLNCNEIEKNGETKIRLQYEEMMTKIKVRTCNKCKSEFTKTDGCNKIVCRCGEKMCYVCRKTIDSYKHFCQHARSPLKACKYCRDCFLWSNADEDDKKALEDLEKPSVEPKQLYPPVQLGQQLYPPVQLGLAERRAAISANLAERQAAMTAFYLRNVTRRN